MDLETDRVKGEVRDSGDVASQLLDTKQIPEDTRVTDKALFTLSLGNQTLKHFMFL